MAGIALSYTKLPSSLYQTILNADKLFQLSIKLTVKNLTRILLPILSLLALTPTYIFKAKLTLTIALVGYTVIS